MSFIYYVDPIGRSLKIDSPDEILSQLSNRQQEYWNSHQGNGFASLTLYDDEKKQVASLVFTKIDGFGFHVDFQLGRSRDLFSFTPSAGEDIAFVFLHGETIYVPRYLFISENQMAEVVKEFFRSGEKSKMVKWIEQKELEWDVVAGRPRQKSKGKKETG